MLPPPPGFAEALFGGRGAAAERKPPGRPSAAHGGVEPLSPAPSAEDLADAALLLVQDSASATLAVLDAGGAGRSPELKAAARTAAISPRQAGGSYALGGARVSEVISGGANGGGGVVGPITVTMSKGGGAAGWGGASASTAVVSFQHQQQSAQGPLAAAPRDTRASHHPAVPGISGQPQPLFPAQAPGSDEEEEGEGAADEAARTRAAHNFGTHLPLPALDMLQSPAKLDIVHQFSDGDASEGAAGGGSGTTTTSYLVTSYWSAHFHALRELCLGSNRAFAQSLAFAEGWDASGGKSGAMFERTTDRRFLVKHVSRTEFDM